MNNRESREIVLIIYFGLYKSGKITKEKFDMIQDRLNGAKKIEGTFDYIKMIIGE